MPVPGAFTLAASLCPTARPVPTTRQTFALKENAIQWAAIGSCPRKNGSTPVETATEIIQLAPLSVTTFSVKFAKVYTTYVNMYMCM